MRDWLIKIRNDHLLTQMAVASHVEISRAYYAQIELEQRDPSVRVARKISRLFGFSWVRFFEEPGAATTVHAGVTHGYTAKGGSRLA